jgi:hypothetical protein
VKGSSESGNWLDAATQTAFTIIFNVYCRIDLLRRVSVYIKKGTINGMSELKTVTNLWFPQTGGNFFTS